MLRNLLVALLVLALLALGTGCAAKKKVAAQPQSTGLNYTLEGVCLRGPIQLIDCDAASPPNCKHITVRYKRGCEKLRTP